VPFIPGLLFGAACIVGGVLLIAFRGQLAQPDAEGKDNFFGKKGRLVPRQSPTLWITFAGIVAIVIGLIAAIRAFYP
jgi:uncharacterized membrane protein HdeD (DUF308 family)